MLLEELTNELRREAGLGEAKMMDFMSGGITVTVTTKAGKKFTGRVQGSGGYIGELRKIQLLAQKATDGIDFGWAYEPQPGFAKMQIGPDNETGRSVDVDFRGAKVVSAQPEDGSTKNRMLYSVGVQVRNLGSSVRNAGDALMSPSQEADYLKNQLDAMIQGQKELTAAIAALRKLAK